MTVIVEDRGAEVVVRVVAAEVRVAREAREALATPAVCYHT